MVTGKSLAIVLIYRNSKVVCSPLPAVELQWLALKLGHTVCIDGLPLLLQALDVAGVSFFEVYESCLSGRHAHSLQHPGKFEAVALVLVDKLKWGH